MPVTTTYPGVYVEELPSSVRTITGVATSIGAFIGWAPRGPTQYAQQVLSWSDFNAQFGGLDARSLLGYAVSHFFMNGGQEAYIVRLVSGDNQTASVILGTAPNTLTLKASSPGDWANQYWIAVKNQAPVTATGTTTSGSTTISSLSSSAGISVGYLVGSSSVPAGTTVIGVGTNSVTLSAAATVAGTGPITFSSGRFRIQVIAAPPGATNFPVIESFENLSIVLHDPQGRFVGDVINNGSNILSVPVGAVGTNATAPPDDTPAVSLPPTSSSPMLSGGLPGTVLQPNHADFETALGVPGNPSTGAIGLLDLVDLFNLLCIPGETNVTQLSVMEKYCQTRRAFLIVDSDQTFTDYTKLKGGSGLTGSNAAFYFPWVLAPDPLSQNAVKPYPPCGFVAGMYATTDVTRGVWKAPAGTETALTGVSGTAVALNDQQNGVLNPVAVNCIRNLKVYGTVLWGARTTDGNDEVGSQWKYIPIRRLALFLEESLYRALQWVVFEPNDEPLWAQIRLNVGAFLQTLFRQGAFQGSTPKQAYFVKCDSDTTTSTDQDNGVVNIVVGFAPLKPAEFVIIQIQQMAGQS
jgi:phage tail sheath protein FI